MEKQSPFKKKVYDIVKNIPKGYVMTYKQVAALAGNKKASRAVGMCMKTNPNLHIVPCHRVVASNGKLTGYSAGGITIKKQKLVYEGVSFIDERVDLKKSQWII